MTEALETIFFITRTLLFRNLDDTMPDQRLGQFSPGSGISHLGICGHDEVRRLIITA